MGLGRIKKPPADRAAQGGHRRHAGAVGRGLEPAGVNQTAPPRCPAHLKGVARKEWRRIVPALWLAGQVGPQDTAGLEMYCSAYARWREALEQVDAGGLVVEGRLGAAPSCWLRVLQEAEAQVARWAARFGLSTKDRAAMGESLRAIAAAKAHTEQAAAAAKPKPKLAAVSNG